MPHTSSRLICLLRQSLNIALAAVLPLVAKAQSTEDSTTPANVPSFLDKTHIGGYGDFTYTRPEEGTPRLDIPRFVIYLDHYFSDKWAFKSETEIEHVKLERGAGGEVSVEQAFLDYHASNKIAWRGGLVLIPMGIINQTHEPNTFYSVERPVFDEVVVPTTWREIGMGIYGDLFEGVKYQFYVTEGLRADSITAEGADGGKQEGSAGDMTSDEIAGSDASHPAASLKIDVYPYAGLRIGGGVYAQPNAVSGPADSDRAVLMGVLDARYDIGALHLRGEGGFVRVGAQGLAAPEARYLSGGYVEAAYNVFSLLQDMHSELLPFVRYEGIGIYTRGRSDAAKTNIVCAGLAFKPLDNLIFKANYRWQSSDGSSEDSEANQFSMGFGYSF
jgi:opacity protein-like surface antigen